MIDRDYNSWDVRNIAKISPKMAKKSHFSIFFDFLKNCPYDSNEIFYSHSTPYYGPLCAISLNSYGWDVRNIAKFSPKMAKKTVIFRFSYNCSYDSNESESEGKRLKPTPLPHMRLWFICFLFSFLEVYFELNNYGLFTVFKLKLMKNYQNLFSKS